MNTLWLNCEMVGRASGGVLASALRVECPKCGRVLKGPEFPSLGDGTCQRAERYLHVGPFRFGEIPGWAFMALLWPSTALSLLDASAAASFWLVIAVLVCGLAVEQFGRSG